MLGEEKLIKFTNESYQKVITKVNDRVYHFLGFGHSNAIAIIGNESIILVDTLDSDKYANDLKEELKKITDKEVKTIIYTHSHPDHRGGAGAFKDTVEEIIDHAPMKTPLKYYDKINDILMKRGARQHGYLLNDEEAICQGIGIREGKVTNNGQYNFVSATTTYTQKKVERVIDGVKLEIVSAPGETDDTVYVYLPDDKVVCTGDNYYGVFPALYAIRGTQYRDLATWIDTLNEILSLDVEAMLPGHTYALIGKEVIQEKVGTFKNAIEYVLFTTLDCMNKGMSMDECVQTVKLPESMQTKDLQEFYGMVEWAVKSVYTGYVGWFDGNPVHLLPVSEQEYNQTLLDLIGEDKLLEKIKDCMDNEQYQLALQLLELTNHQELKKECLLKRAKQVTSANARHYYITCAKE
jgi:alkyl sulfatase BDS1-like metallo-beta-lactamase superfamily hydrolase